MALNLAPIQALIEAQFLDDVLEVRPASDAAQATKILNKATGLLEDPAAPPSLVYEGPGSIFPATTTSRIEGVDEQQIPKEVDADYKGLLPLAANTLETGHILQVTQSLRDQFGLVGVKFRIQQAVSVSTFSVCRILWLKRLKQGS
jgi:hypothetical protein